MRKVIAAVTALGLVSASALAADNAAKSPLPPGKPAGVKQANLSDNGTLVAIGLISAGLIAGIVASQNSSTGTFISSSTSP